MFRHVFHSCHTYKFIADFLFAVILTLTTQIRREYVGWLFVERDVDT